MAQYSPDFSAETLGEAPSFLGNLTNALLEVMEDESGKFIRFSQADRHAKANFIPSGQTTGDTQILVKFRINGYTQYRRGFGPFIHGTSSVNPGYTSVSRRAANYENTLAYDIANLSGATQTITTKIDVWQWHLFRVRKTSTAPDTFTVESWIWDDGDTPLTTADTPTLQATGQTSATGSGYLGFYADDLNQTVDIGAFAVGTDGDDAVITSDAVNDGEPVLDGQTSVPFVYDEGDFLTPITDARYKLGAVVSPDLANFSASGGAGTFDDLNIKGLAIDQVGPPFGTISLELRNAEESVELIFARSPAAGWSTQILTGDQGTEGYISEGRVAGAYSDGSVAYFPSSQNVTIEADGQIFSEGNFTAFVWDVDSDTWEVVTFITTDPTDDVSGSIVKSILSSVVKPIVS